MKEINNLTVENYFDDQDALVAERTAQIREQGATSNNVGLQRAADRKADALQYAYEDYKNTSNVDQDDVYAKKEAELEALKAEQAAVEDRTGKDSSVEIVTPQEKMDNFDAYAKEELKEINNLTVDNYFDEQDEQVAKATEQIRSQGANSGNAGLQRAADRKADAIQYAYEDYKTNATVTTATVNEKKEEKYTQLKQEQNAVEKDTGKNSSVYIPSTKKTGGAKPVNNTKSLLN